MDTIIFNNAGIYETICVHKTEKRFTILYHSL
jgi:hypothetical protein